MDKDFSNHSEVPALSPDEIRALFEFQETEIKDLQFLNRILSFESKMQLGHIKLQNSQLEKLQKEIENLRNTCISENGKISLLKKLQAKILRLSDKSYGNSISGEYRRWKFYRKYENKGLVFSEKFFAFLAIQKVVKELCPEQDTGLRIPASIPKTSIILQASDPVKTVRFLEIFFQKAPQVPFEIIVTGKVDKLARLVKYYPSLRVVRETDNAGICAQAAGDYLLFAGDDFALAPDALDELACALFRKPDARSIGAQVFHGTGGKLLESGTILCGNGELIRQGFGVSPDEPEINFFRECDLFAHPVFITQKSTFIRSAVSGEQFIAEALTADKQNYVMPLAKILFFGDENGCADIYREFRFDEKNVTSRRWRSRDDWENSSKFAKPAILYIDAEIPKPDRGSGGMDVIFFVEYMLKRGYQVLFFGENTPGFVPKYTPMLQRLGVACFTKGERAFVEYLALNGRHFDFAFVSRVYQAQSFDIVIKKYLPQAVYIFNTVDVHFVREKLEAELNDSADDLLHAAMTEQVELTVMSRSDAVIVISSDEKKMLEKDHGIGNCFHIPQAREIAGRKEPLKARSGMVFIGSAHPPNLDALKYYVQDILPLLKARNIDGTLTVIGEALKNDIFAREDMKMVTDCPEIRFIGFVEELGDCLDSARMTIAPLRYGAGTKGKVASSMSYGVPCISSSFGTEGTGMIDGENILIARDSQEFADAIAKLLSDDELWQKISDGGLRFLEENYATAAVEKQMDELWTAAVNNHQKRADSAYQLTVENFSELPDTGTYDPTAAVQEILFRDNAAIFFESDTVREENLAKRCPNLKNGANILLEKARFDLIILSKPLTSDARSIIRLKHAAKLLFDGGMILLPADSGMDAEAFFQFFKGELPMQNIEFVPSCNTIILTKSIPSPAWMVSEN